MTSEKEEPTEKEKSLQTLEEICENTRAIRRVVNRILDHLHEYASDDEDNHNDYDPDSISWRDLDNGDDMYM
jgi:hypothetical protein